MIKKKKIKILSFGQEIQIKIYSEVERVWGHGKSEIQMFYWNLQVT